MFTMRNLRSPLWTIAITVALALATGALALAARPTVGSTAAAHGGTDCSATDLAALKSVVADVQTRLDTAVGAGLSADVAGEVTDRLAKVVERCANDVEEEDKDTDTDQDEDDQQGAEAGLSFGQLFQACFSAADGRQARIDAALTQIKASIASAVADGSLMSEQAAELNTRLDAFARDCAAGDASFRDLFRGLFGERNHSDARDHSDRDRTSSDSSSQKTTQISPARVTATPTQSTVRTSGDRSRDDRHGSRHRDGSRSSRG